MIDVQTVFEVADQLERLQNQAAAALALLKDTLPKSPPEALEKAEKGICLNCGRPIEGRAVRGCDEACYQALNRKCKSGKAVDADLITGGFWLRPAPSGRKPVSTLDVKEEVRKARARRPKK